jgi:hypothetical protein
MSGMAERSSKLGHLGIGSAGAWKHCRETLCHSVAETERIQAPLFLSQIWPRNGNYGHHEGWAKE